MAGTKPTHGLSRTRVYRIWAGMHARCKKNLDYITKGIVPCKRWGKFERFFEDMGHPPTDQHSLDRKDHTKGYSKANCRWATRIEQNNNTTRNKFPGRMVRQEALAAGIPVDTIYYRLKVGYTLDEALNLKPYQRKITPTKADASDHRKRERNPKDDNSSKRRPVRGKRQHDNDVRGQGARKPKRVKDSRAGWFHVRDRRCGRSVT